MAFHNGPRIVTDQLVYFIDSQNSKCYPGSGTAAFDLSKANLSNTADLGTVPIDSQGMVFDGTNYVTIMTGTAMSTFLVNEFSFELWCKDNGTTEVNTNLVGSRYSANYSISMLDQGSGNVQILGATDPSGNINAPNESSVAINDGMWHHIVGTFNNGNFNVYVDLNKVTNTTRAGESIIIDNLYDLTIGGDNTASRDWIGWIDHVKIYHKELSDIEVQQNYDAVKGRYL